MSNHLVIRRTSFLILHFYLDNLKPIDSSFISSFISQTEGSSQIIVKVVFTSNISGVQKNKNNKKKKQNKKTEWVSSLGNQ